MALAVHVPQLMIKSFSDIYRFGIHLDHAAQAVSVVERLDLLEVHPDQIPNRQLS